MKTVIDTHVHVYPCYNQQVFWNNFLLNTRNLPAEWIRAICLAERSDSDWYAQTREKGKFPAPGYDLEIRENGEALFITAEDGQSFYVFPGTQIVTSERIEVLSLTTAVEGLDGLPAKETVKRALAEGGVPVLSWAPGKWFFERGKVVAKIINEFTPGNLLIGDTSLRPGIWLEPILMRKAKQKGLGIIAGSDPLPFRGEERYPGSLVSAIETAFNPEKPAFSTRNALLSEKPEITHHGKHCGTITALSRIFRCFCSPRA